MGRTAKVTAVAAREDGRMGMVEIKFDSAGNLVFNLQDKTDVETVNKACWGKDEKYVWEQGEKVDWSANNAEFQTKYPDEKKVVIPPLLKNENPSRGLIIRDAAPIPTSSPPLDKVCPCKLLPNEPCNPG